LLAGRAPLATIDIQRAAEPDPSDSILDTIGIRTWSVLASMVMMIAMIAMLAVPVILAEETEKKTVDALLLVASHAEVVVAKALVGFAYCLIMMPLFLAITGMRPRWPPYLIGIVLLAITLIGLGLLMGSVFRNANQLNTWSGVILLPVITPAFVVGLPTPDVVRTIAELTPTGAATKLLINSAASPAPFGQPALDAAVLIAWAVIAYALLLWRLSRQQA
jgi:ABC-2 type transport system permease protein